MVELIGIHNLDEQYAQQLPPSVRADYVECLEEMRREREYEARQDREIEKLERKKNGGESES